MDILYTTLVQWYCQACGDCGEAENQHLAEKQAERHECNPPEVFNP